MNPIKGFRHTIMGFVFVAVGGIDNPRLVAVATKECHQFVIAHAAIDGRLRNLIAIEMKNRQDHTVFARIDEFIEVPCTSGWTRFGFTVSDKTGHDQARIIEDSAVAGT